MGNKYESVKLGERSEKDLIDHLNQEIDSERQEVLKLMDIIHYYEAVAAFLRLEVKNEDLEPKLLHDASDFAEKVTKKNLISLYANQDSLTMPEEDYSLYIENIKIH